LGEEVELRAKNYIGKVRRLLDGISVASARPRFVQASEIESVLQESRRYLEDSEFYVGVGDSATGLACISYSEGLLDCMRLLGILEFQW
jgi:FAD synthetase